MKRRSALVALAVVLSACGHAPETSSTSTSASPSKETSTSMSCDLVSATVIDRVVRGSELTVKDGTAPSSATPGLRLGVCEVVDDAENQTAMTVSVLPPGSGQAENLLSRMSQGGLDYTFPPAEGKGFALREAGHDGHGDDASAATAALVTPRFAVVTRISIGAAQRDTVADAVAVTRDVAARLPAR